MERSPSKRRDVLPEGWWSAETCWSLDPDECTFDLSDEAKSRIEACHGFLLSKAGQGEVIYGINTGFGDLATTVVDDLHGLQRNLLISHACGVGEPLPQDVVRMMLLLKVKGLSQGHSGVALTTVQRLLDHWNANVLPVVPEQGSLGASGDLAPLAHMVLPLIGLGEVTMPDGRRLPSGEALAEFGWAPLELGPKEGLALINGTQMMLGVGMVALQRIERLASWADAVGAWSLEAWNGLEAAMHPPSMRCATTPGPSSRPTTFELGLRAARVWRSPGRTCKTRIRSGACPRSMARRGM